MKMDVEIIYNKLKEQQIEKEYFFNRELILITYKDFKKYEKEFTKPVKIGTKLNYRTNHTFKHIHAIQNKHYVQFHYDYGNLYQNILMSIPHFFIDVIPYYFWFLIKLKKPYEFKAK